MNGINKQYAAKMEEYHDRIMSISDDINNLDERIKGFVTDIDLVSSLYKKTCDEIDQKNMKIEEMNDEIGLLTNIIHGVRKTNERIQGEHNRKDKLMLAAMAAREEAIKANASFDSTLKQVYIYYSINFMYLFLFS